VVGGTVLWKPVDRLAAKMLAKSPWWAQPVHVPTPPPAAPAAVEKAKKKRTHKIMGDNAVIVETGDKRAPQDVRPRMNDASYTSACGLEVHRINGQDMISLESAQTVLCAEIAKMPKETRPLVLAAQDARRIVNELTDGIGADQEKFRVSAKMFLEDVRQTRFAVVQEASAMMTPLRDVRTFFLGPDYKEQVTRLKEFVELCERLQKLKESGFLDNVADTMLRLADRPATGA